MLIQNKNIENQSQKMIVLSDNMFDYNVRLLVWAGNTMYSKTLYKAGNKYLMIIFWVLVFQIF